MDSTTIINEAGGSTTSIPKELKDLHKRNISVDSGIDVSESSNSVEQSDSTTETDLLKEKRTTGHDAIIYHKKSETACNNASSSQSSDSDFSRNISQESNESAFQGMGEDYPDCSETAASRAVQKFYDDLVQVISNLVSVDQLEPKLFSESLIDRSVHQEMRVDGKSDQSKTCRVLDAVMTKLMMSPTYQESFERFLEILDSYLSCLDVDLVVKIKAEYQRLSNEVSEHANEGQGPSQQSSSFFSQDTSTEEDAATLNPSKNPFSLHNSVPYLLTFYSPFGISLFLVISLLLLLSNLIVLHWTLNQADMKKLEMVHPSSAFDESIAAIYIEEKQQLEEQLLMAQRQILQLNREVLDLKMPRNHLCTGANERKITCKKQVMRLIEEKMDYVAKIENLTQQRNLLLNGCAE